MRAWVIATVGILASGPHAVRAEPGLEASGFLGVGWFGRRSELGNSWAPEQVPGTAPVVGGRVSWLVLPALPRALALAVEAELALTTSFTGEDQAHGRMAYAAPVIAWRAHAQLRLARWRSFQPHLVLGGGGETVASSSPFMSSETDPVAYWGAGAAVPITDHWRLRLDVRHGVMPARNGGATSTLELELALGASFGGVQPRGIVAPPPPPPQPDDPSPPDPDGDGIVGDADMCPDAAEDFDGFQDADGCPEPDNDRDGIDDVHDACPNVTEVYNGYEDEDGCPDRVPDDVTAALAAIVRFERGRARITPTADAALQPLLEALVRRRALRLVITGHPDRAGGDDLARRRADAVKWYLIDGGVTEDRIATSASTVIDGEAAPIELQLAVGKP